MSTVSIEGRVLGTPSLRALRDKIKSGRKTLKEVYGSPLYGIKTGLNAAFVIDTATKDRLCIEDPKSSDLIKPFLEGKDLKRWRDEPRDLWLIFTRRGTDIDAYPAIKAHLEKMRDALEPKPKGWKPQDSKDKWPGRKAGSYKWFEIQDTVDYHEQFQRPKVLYPEFCDKPQFQLNESHYFNNKCYFVPTPDT